LWKQTAAFLFLLSLFFPYFLFFILSLNSGRTPQTGIYVRAKRVDNGTLLISKPNVYELQPDIHSKVICNNEFGCHANDILRPLFDTRKTNKMDYPINHTVHSTKSGVKLAQPPAYPNGASKHFVRKAVCKCNNGYTSPLQIQSSWCGQECPGPDCSLLTTNDDMNHEWCDDLVDGSGLVVGRSKKRCKAIHKNKTLYNDQYSNTLEFDSKKKFYVENFYSDQGELRHMDPRFSQSYKRDIHKCYGEFDSESRYNDQEFNEDKSHDFTGYKRNCLSYW
jgi:hypothetical protein